VLVSDLSGNEIRDEKESAQVVIRYGALGADEPHSMSSLPGFDDLASKGR
jgi:hypothetical protein